MYGWFLALAAQLQTLRGDDFLMPCGPISGLIGVDTWTVAGYRSLALEQGLLHARKAHETRTEHEELTEFEFDHAILTTLVTQRGG
jgi:hypothetical protein